jgi:phosphatidylserine/phosphatidylglycerophosphate/cardiolipin synthase-like enzyme
VAIGNNIALNSFDRWLKERSKLSNEVNVRFVHTKYMLVDPLGPHPVVVTGSANFSRASTDTNDENMIVIRDDPRVADIYLGEFMRLLSLRLRGGEVIRPTAGIESSARTSSPTDAWQKDYYRDGHQVSRPSARQQVTLAHRRNGQNLAALPADAPSGKPSRLTPCQTPSADSHRSRGRIGWQPLPPGSLTQYPHPELRLLLSFFWRP